MTWNDFCFLRQSEGIKRASNSYTPRACYHPIRDTTFWIDFITIIILWPPPVPRGNFWWEKKKLLLLLTKWKTDSHRQCQTAGENMRGARIFPNSTLVVGRPSLIYFPVKMVFPLFSFSSFSERRRNRASNFCSKRRHPSLVFRLLLFLETFFHFPFAFFKVSIQRVLRGFVMRV